MTIVTGVSTSNVVPNTFNVFNYLRAGGSLISVPLVVAIIGVKSAAGTGVVGQVYDADDAAVTDALCGANSEAAMMCRQAFLTGRVLERGPRVRLTLLAEPAGVARIQTITFVGSATVDGNKIIRVAGREFSIGVQSGQGQNTIAASCADQLQRRAEELPVVVTVATNVVTLTHPHTGVNGQDDVVEVDQQVTGCVATVAQTAAGTGDADITPGLTALSPLRYDGIAIANHKTADVTAILLDAATRWSPQSKTWGWYFMFEPGTIGTATTLAAAANHRAVIVANMEGCRNAAGEGAVTTAMLVFSREQANAGYDGATVPLFPPNAGTLYTDSEKNTAILAGLTVYEGKLASDGSVVENRARCVQLVTSKTTIGVAVPDDRNRDIAVSRVGVHVALQLHYATEAAVGADNNPTGVPQEDSVTLIIDLASAILRAEARAGIISKKFVESDVAAIRCEPDDVVLGRNNTLVPYHPNIPLHQVVFRHDITVGINA
jgi:phage tail sheath gpL-like